MREILFRGKHNDKWVFGSLLYDEENNKAFIAEHFEDGAAYMREVVTESVSEFTGLTDKNGKKVFEGDIGRYRQKDGARRKGKPIICTGEVIYFENASFAVESKDEEGCKYFDYFPITDFEVIGNMHDNPELLRGE